MIVRNKREKERSQRLVEFGSEGRGISRIRELTIYAEVLLRVQTMTPSIVRDNARLSHVALTRVNGAMNTTLP